MSAALDGLVARVVGDIVLLVRLEQVAGAHGVAACQDSLETRVGDGGVTSVLGGPLAGVAIGGRLKSGRRYLLSDQNGGALQWHAHHLVGVPGDGVGPAKG